MWFADTCGSWKSRVGLAAPGRIHSMKGSLSSINKSILFKTVLKLHESTALVHGHFSSTTSTCNSSGTYVPDTGKGGSVCPGDAHHPVQSYRKRSHQSVLEARTDNDLQHPVREVGCESVGCVGVAVEAACTGGWGVGWGAGLHLCINVSA